MVPLASCGRMPSLFGFGHVSFSQCKIRGTVFPFPWSMATPAKNKDLHGSAPERCPVALLMVDVINDLEFEGGDKLLRHALAMAQRLAALARRARAAGVPVIYANDNFGKWRSDFRTTLEH